MYRCFGCSSSGSVLDFWLLYRGTTLNEAANGNSLPSESSNCSPASTREAKRRCTSWTASDSDCNESSTWPDWPPFPILTTRIRISLFLAGRHQVHLDRLGRFWWLAFHLGPDLAGAYPGASTRTTMDALHHKTTRVISSRPGSDRCRVRQSEYADDGPAAGSMCEVRLPQPPLGASLQPEQP